jgi:hypothetical protein
MITGRVRSLSAVRLDSDYTFTVSRQQDRRFDEQGVRSFDTLDAVEDFCAAAHGAGAARDPEAAVTEAAP